MTPKILESIGCHSISSYAKEYRAGLPNDSNKTKISVRKENLSSSIYGAEKSIQGDIISIVMEIQRIEFVPALKKIHSILEIPFKINYKSKKDVCDILAIFKNVRCRKKNNELSIKKYDESYLMKSNYLDLPHISLIHEGIVPNVAKEFDVMYDTRTNRILFPHRYWSSGDLVGIFGRTTVEQYDVLGIPKYFGILPYAKSLNLYGLYQNYKAIQNMGYVIVCEAEKSCLKAKSMGFPNVVSLGGHGLSNEQIKILIGLNVDIIFALDKDLDKQISIDMCKEFKGIRNASYIHDKYDLLGEKDAPIDKGIKIFKYLLKYKIEVV